MQRLSGLIEEMVDEALNEVLRKFNLRNFKQLEDTKAQIKYASKHLPQIGSGTSRTVFALSGNKVLKIAGAVGFGEYVGSTSISRGKAQNQEEVNMFTNPKTKPIIAAVYDAADDYSWLISEIVKPFKSAYTFNKAVGIDEHLLEVVLAHYRKYQDVAKTAEETAKFFWREYERYDEMLPDPVDDATDVEELAELITEVINTNKVMAGSIGLIDLGAASGDLSRWDHWGTDLQGNIKLLDYGLSREVFNQYYR